jgi:uncharacterized membrane protein
MGWDVASLLVIAGTLVLSWMIEPELPARIATHFDLYGNPNGYSSREFGARLLPLVSIAIWVLMRFGMLAAPESWRARMVNAPMAAASFLMVAFLSGLHIAILNAALHGGIGLGRELVLLLGACWIGLALLFPRVRRNPIFGVRTAWTLSSDENWARTHRVASYTFFVGGAVCVIAGVVGATAAVSFGMVVGVASALVPAVYSWSIARHT